MPVAATLSINAGGPFQADMDIKLKYLSEERDRHGNMRLYVRIAGRRARIHSMPGSPEFLDEYRSAVAANAQPSAASPERTRGPAKAGTLRFLIEAYFGSAEFKGLDPRTQRVRRQILERVCDARASDGAEFAVKPFRLLEPRHVRKLRDDRADMPEAANAMVKAVRQVFTYAIAADLADRNPAKDVPYLKSGSTGFHTWSIDEVHQFERRHAIGTKARLALALLLYSGQRRSDIVQFGRQHVRAAEAMPAALRASHAGRWLAFTQHKNRKHAPVALTLPLLPELESIIGATPCGDLTWLISQRGRPFSSASFGGWFRKRCNEAGLHHCAAHGLRKAGATIAAERGASERQLMAIFGWRSSKQATLYTRAANQQRLAGDAMRLLGEGQSANETVAPETANAKGATISATKLLKTRRSK